MAFSSNCAAELAAGATVSLRRPEAFGLPPRNVCVVRVAAHADDATTRFIAVVPSGSLSLSVGGTTTFRDAAWVPETEVQQIVSSSSVAAGTTTPTVAAVDALLLRPAGITYLGMIDPRPARTDTSSFLRSVACPTTAFTAQVCPRCLSLWATLLQLTAHLRECRSAGVDGVVGRIPGQDVYVDATVSATGLTVRMLDGAVHTAFCRNLAVLGAHTIADKDLSTDIDVAEFFVVLGRPDFIFRGPGEAAEATARLREASAMPDDQLFVLGYFARIKMQPFIALTTVCAFAAARGRGIGSFMFDVALYLSSIRARDCGNDACCGRLPGRLQEPLSDQGRALLIRECARRLHFNNTARDVALERGAPSSSEYQVRVRPFARAFTAATTTTTTTAAAAPSPQRSLEDQMLNPRRRPREEAVAASEFIVAARGLPSKVVRAEAPLQQPEIIDLVTTSDDDDDADGFSQPSSPPPPPPCDFSAPSKHARLAETMDELTARLLGVHPADGELFWRVSGLLFAPGRRSSGPWTFAPQPNMIRAIATGAAVPLRTAEADEWCATHPSVAAPFFNPDHVLHDAYTASAYHYGSFSL